MKVELKQWQAMVIIAVVLIAPHLNGFVALALAIFCLLIAAVDCIADKWEARDEP